MKLVCVYLDRCLPNAYPLQGILNSLAFLLELLLVSPSHHLVLSTLINSTFWTKKELPDLSRSWCEHGGSFQVTFGQNLYGVGGTSRLSFSCIFPFFLLLRSKGWNSRTVNFYWKRDTWKICKVFSSIKQSLFLCDLTWILKLLPDRNIQICRINRGGCCSTNGNCMLTPALRAMNWINPTFKHINCS